MFFEQVEAGWSVGDIGRNQALAVCESSEAQRMTALHNCAKRTSISASALCPRCYRYVCWTAHTQVLSGVLDAPKNSFMAEPATLELAKVGCHPPEGRTPAVHTAVF